MNENSKIASFSFTIFDFHQKHLQNLKKCIRREETCKFLRICYCIECTVCSAYYEENRKVETLSIE